MKSVWELLWTVVRKTFLEWRRHRSGEMAGALSFFASIALVALALVVLYLVGAYAPQPLTNSTSSNLGHFVGSHYGDAVGEIARAARAESWIALVVGLLLFAIATFATAMQLQAALNFIWEVHDPKEDLAVSEVARELPAFLLVFVLTLVLIVVLLLGAALHALAFVTHAVPMLDSLVMQFGNFLASVVVLTLLFVGMFARLPPQKIPRRAIWLGGFLTAVMYERAQFFLALYLGSLDVRSLYADVGVALAILIWLYYSAQVVLIGANLTKVIATCFVD